MSGAAEDKADKKVRVGLLGVNTSHASAYARILNEAEAIPGAHLEWVWGGQLRADQPDTATLAEKYSIGKVASEPTEFLGETDLVLVVDDTGGGANHVPLARPFVKAGVPTFVDKPMAVDIDEARSLFEVAARSGAPVTSSSALRFARELEDNREELSAVGQLSSIVSVGPGEWYYYGVHAVEQLYAVAGGGVEWVQRSTWPDRDVAVLSYSDGPTAIVQTLRDASYAFHVTAFGKDGLHAVRIADFGAFYTRQLAAAVEMARTGTPPISPAETLELLAVLRAGVLSAERDGARVTIAEALDKP